jgi:peptide/nickel transport system substrate-binding protein
MAGGQLYRAHASTAHQSGGTLTIAYSQVPDTLNPVTTGYTTVWVMLRDLFDSLVYQTPSGKITPWLATKWKTYTFFLRHGVTFHDGTPFDAAAVVYNWNYIENPNTHSVESITLLGPYKNARAIGKYEVVLNLKSAFSPLLTYLGMPIMGFQSPTAIKKYGKQVGNHPVGTGPFEFVSYVRPTTLTYQRNPKYDWAPPALHYNGPAKLDKVVWSIASSGNVRVDALQTGQAQLATGIPTLFFKTLKNNPNYRPLYVPIDGSGVYSMFNTARWPTNSAAVRQAILYAIDRVGVIKLADSGQYAPTWGPLQKGTIGYDPAFNGAYAYNPGKAAKILTSAGWKKVNGIWTKGGKKLTVTWTSIAQAGDFTDMATGSASYLTKFGIVVNIRPLAGTAWEANNTSGAYNITGPLQFSLDDPDLLRVMFTRASDFDWSRYNNPTYTKLVLQAEGAPTTQARVKLYWKAEKILVDQGIMLPVRYNEDLELTSSKLHGVLITKGGFQDHYLATLG